MMLTGLHKSFYNNTNVRFMVYFGRNLFARISAAYAVVDRQTQRLRIVESRWLFRPLIIVFFGEQSELTRVKFKRKEFINLLDLIYEELDN